MTSHGAQSVPVAENLFTFGDDDGVALIGTRCDACDAHYFPQASHCRNPECPGGALTRTLLGHRGHLYSWTVQTYQPPPLFRIEPWAPYTLGLIDLPEGLRVMGMLTDERERELEVGMEMQLVAEPLYVDAEGRNVLTYKYRADGAR